MKITSQNNFQISTSDKRHFRILKHIIKNRFSKIYITKIDIQNIYY